MKFNKSAGQASRLLLVLAIIVFVAVIITYLVVRMAEKPAAPEKPITTSIELPVYEKPLGNIDFVFISAIDRGTALKVSEITNNQYSSASQKDLVTKEKFIQVTIGAQNTGTVNTDKGAWTIENIIDSKGRNFIPIEGYTVNPWLPSPDLCGELLKPAFSPTPCTKIYEVAKESTGLKIRIQTGEGNTAQNLSSGKIQSALIDLIVK